MSKKSKSDIYNIIIAHRGYHVNFPENSISSFKEAIKQKLAIEADIRITKDDVLVCFHDRHLKRLLGINGKIINYNYDYLNKLCIKNSNEIIPRLKDLFEINRGKVALLLEIKGNINKKLKNILCRELNEYNGEVYFHTKNIFTYLYLHRIFGDDIFFILNPFRKRFNFVKIYDKNIKYKI